MLFHILIQVIRRHFDELVGFEVHLDDLSIIDTVLAQMSSHQLEQTGFAAAADAGHDLDRLCVLKGDELV